MSLTKTHSTSYKQTQRGKDEAAVEEYSTYSIDWGNCADDAEAQEEP